jgi:hypothetical protein
MCRATVRVAAPNPSLHLTAAAWRLLGFNTSPAAAAGDLHRSAATRRCEMTDEPGTTKKNRWRVRVMLALIVVIVIAIGGTWWIGRPERTADHFIALVSKGQLEEADALLLDPSSIDIDAAGNVVITASDGNSTTLNKDELPLIGLEPFYFRPREGFGDYLAGRYRFPVVTSGPAVQRELKEPMKVSAIATGDRIVIVTIK